MKKKQNIKNISEINSNEEKNNEIKSEVDVGGKVSEERINQILADVKQEEKNENANEPNEKTRKDELREAFKKKYEKGKLRPGNLTTFIFLIIAGAAVISELAYCGFFLITGFFNASRGFNKIFGGGDSIGSVLSSMGYFLYFVILIVGLAIVVYAIYLAIMSIIDTAKLNFLKDEDYMMNLYIKKITMREILPLIPVELILIFVLPFVNFSASSSLAFVVFVNIPLMVIHLGCLISIFAQAFASKIRFKNSTTALHYKEVVDEKNRILQLYKKRRKTDGSGRLY